MLWTDFHFCWTRQLHIFVLWCILTGGIKYLLNTHLRGFAVWHMPLILTILQCILVFRWTNLEISRILWTTRCDSATIKSDTSTWKFQEKLNMHVSWHDWNMTLETILHTVGFMFALMMVLETNLSWELILFPESFEDNI